MLRLLLRLFSWRHRQASRPAQPDPEALVKRFYRHQEC
jgi:hypothetical protein